MRWIEGENLPNSRQPLCRLQVFPYAFTYDAYWFFCYLRERTSPTARLRVESSLAGVYFYTFIYAGALLL